MFKMTKNNFLRNGIVRYADEKGNRIAVSGKVGGGNFHVTFRPANEKLNINTIEFTFPFNIDGAHFSVVTKSFSDEEYESLTEEANKLLEDAREVITRWFCINTLLCGLNASNMNKIMRLVGGNEDDKGNTYVNIINSLKEYEEMKDLVTLYEKAIYAK